MNISNLSLTELSTAVVFINIALSFLLAVIIAVIYQRTHRGLSYSRSYVESLVMMSVLAAIAMMILGNNLVRALGILGVFTLIRFRTIIKDPKDATYLFFSLAIGMGVGTGNYAISVIGTVCLLAIILIMDRFSFGSVVRDGFLLTFIAGADYNSYENIFPKFLRSYKLLQFKSRLDGEGEYYFSVSFKDGKRPQDLVNELTRDKSVKLADLITGKDTAEY